MSLLIYKNNKWQVNILLWDVNVIGKTYWHLNLTLLVRPFSLRLRKANDTFFIFAIIVPTVHRTASASKYLDFHRVSEGGFLGQQRSWARGAEARSVTPGRSNGLVFLPGVLSVWETLRSATAVWMWTADMRGRPVQVERLGWQVLRKSLAPMSPETLHFQHALVSVPYNLLCPHFFLLHIAALFVVNLGQLFYNYFYLISYKIREMLLIFLIPTGTGWIIIEVNPLFWN